jgi:hypothetical protein
MRAPKFKYRLFRASNGRRSFWRWEVHQSGKKRVLEAGTLYGSADDAKHMAEAAIFRLRHRTAPQAEAK